MKSNKDYWHDREKAYDNVYVDLKQQLKQAYLNTYKKTEQQLVSLYNEILIKSQNGTLLVNDLYKFDKYYILINELQEELEKLGLKEEIIYKDKFQQLYLTNSQLLGEEIGFVLPVAQEEVEKAISLTWCRDGKNWSQRIWDNKTLLQDRITKGLVDCIQRGDSKDRMVKQLMADFGVGYNYADRIARTELCYIQNKACLDRFNQAGVEYYKVLPAHDNRTCEVCGEIEGKVFRLSEAQIGVNMPPLHPNCRDTVIAVFK